MTKNIFINDGGFVCYLKYGFQEMANVIPDERLDELRDYLLERTPEDTALEELLLRFLYRKLEYFDKEKLEEEEDEEDCPIDEVEYMRREIEEEQKRIREAEIEKSLPTYTLEDAVLICLKILRPRYEEYSFPNLASHEDMVLVEEEDTPVKMKRLRLNRLRPAFGADYQEQELSKNLYAHVQECIYLLKKEIEQCARAEQQDYVDSATKALSYFKEQAIKAFRPNHEKTGD